MRQDVYGVAYQEAKSELLDITCRFEELRQRKDRLEGVIAALSPMLGEKAVAPIRLEVAASAAPAPQSHTQAPAQTFNEVSTPENDPDDAITDPFERRVRNALKFGGSRRGDLQAAV
ncbi:MAG TPA: hypothetical protein VE291_10860 [Terracidiphilus sp.]|jgi:hypothetical protein|nr:hypothetical protein [Terracidiphilus sp.]